MPSLDSVTWRNHTDEILWIESFLESMVIWLALVNEKFSHEVKCAATSLLSIEQHMLQPDQLSRGARLLPMLRQIVQNTPKARIILMEYMEGVGEKNGFEEYVIRTRQELLHFRTNC